MPKGNAYYNPAPRHGPSQGTIEATALVALALAGLRRLHGPDARPEDCPQEWARIVREVREDLAHEIENAAWTDEGGEA